MPVNKTLRILIPPRGRNNKPNKYVPYIEHQTVTWREIQQRRWVGRAGAEGWVAVLSRMVR